MPTLHDEENCAQHGLILAQEINRRRFAKVGMNHLESTKFTCHVVGFGSDRSERTASKHILAVFDSQQIGEVRVSAGKLFNGDALLSALDFSAEKLGESSEVQFFAETNGSGIAIHQKTNLP
jgi:hypothetical protein